MKSAWALARPIAALLAVSVGLVALLVAVTLLASGRSFSQFGHIVIDLGAVVAVLLLVAIGLVYLPVAWAMHRRLGLTSRPSAIAGGALTGCVAFLFRAVLFRDTGDPPTLSAYVAFLWQSPWELAGLVPFVVGGIVFALAARPDGRSSHAARLDPFRNV